ncbi:competence protein CoiA [Pseudalkalibacillus sp. SCS-8]|uniref:competence protein CoiA n=1 Tax=Pseudalkalibacillus nanhaiensis TaxID=3115291 RepID=UPI0032DBE946
MLTALRENGELLNLAIPQKKSTLLDMKNNEQFRCPVCKRKMMIRLGEKRIWHFSHEKGSICRADFEPESMYHLFGKKQLYQQLVNQSLNVELETYLPHLKQRPDLFVTNLSPPIAIEYQCATIPTDLLFKRTTTFLKAGILPYWILGKKRLNNVSNHLYRFDELSVQALCWIERSNSSPFLLYYCPLTSAFTMLYGIFPFSTNTFFALHEIFSLNRFKLPFFLKNPSLRFPNEFVDLWIQKLTNARLYLHVNKQASVISLKRMFLNRGITPCLFPLEAGMPLKHGIWFETPAYVWQSVFLVEILHPFPLDTSFEFRDVYRGFVTHMPIYKIKIRKGLNMPDSHFSYALMDYLCWLSKIGILKKTGKATFRKKKEIRFPNTIEGVEDKVRQMILSCR